MPYARVEAVPTFPRLSRLSPTSSRDRFAGMIGSQPSRGCPDFPPAVHRLPQVDRRRACKDCRGWADLPRKGLPPLKFQVPVRVPTRLLKTQGMIGFVWRVSTSLPHSAVLFGAVSAPGDLGPSKPARRAETARKADRPARLDAPVGSLQRGPRGSNFPSDVENTGEIGFVCAVFSAADTCPPDFECGAESRVAGGCKRQD